MTSKIDQGNALSSFDTFRSECNFQGTCQVITPFTQRCGSQRPSYWPTYWTLDLPACLYRHEYPCRILSAAGTDPQGRRKTLHAPARTYKVWLPPKITRGLEHAITTIMIFIPPFCSVYAMTGCRFQVCCSRRQSGRTNSGIAGVARTFDVASSLAHFDST